MLVEYSLAWKILKKHFLTSVWSAQCPNAGQNIQQSRVSKTYYHCKELLRAKQIENATLTDQLLPLFCVSASNRLAGQD